MTTALRQAAFALAVDHPDLALSAAKRITDEEIRDNTIGKVVKGHIEGQNDLARFTTALQMVREIKLIPAKERALHRIDRHAKTAGLESVKESVKSVAKELGCNPDNVERKRQEKTQKFQLLAFGETAPLRAFFYAAQMAEGRDEAIATLLDTFDYGPKSDHDYKSADEQRLELFKQRGDAIPLETTRYSKQLEKIARKFVSLCMWEEAKDTIKLIEDSIVRAHATSPTGSIVRLVNQLNPRREFEFTALR